MDKEEPQREEHGSAGGWKENVTWQCALTYQKANSVLGLHQNQCGQKIEGGDSAPLLCLCETAFDLQEQSRKQHQLSGSFYYENLKCIVMSSLRPEIQWHCCVTTESNQGIYYQWDKDLIGKATDLSVGLFTNRVRF